MTRFEKLTLGVSAVALVVSLLSAGASIWVYQKTTTSILRFSIGADFSQKSIRFEKLTDGPNAVRFRKHAFLVLTNVGNAPLTVQFVRIYPIKPRMNNLEAAEWAQAVSHSGPWEGDTKYGPVDEIFSSADGKPFSFPVTIEPRRVVNVEVFLNVPIPRELWQQVENRISTDSDLNYSDVERIFSDAGIPHWGYDAPTLAGGGPRVTSHFRYFLVQIAREDGKVLYGEFDLLGFQGEQGE